MGDAKALSGLVYACLTHVPLWLGFPAFVTPLYMGAAQGPGQLNLRDLVPEWEPHHPVLGGLVGTFALRRHVLGQRAQVERVGLCQYRKFISRERFHPVPAPTYPGMDVVPLDVLVRQDFARLMDPGDLRFLVSRPLQFTEGSQPRLRKLDILAQYGRAHRVEDLLRFAAAAVDLGVLQPEELTSFFGQTDFVPGGLELGVYEVDFWLRSVEQLESVVRACIERQPAHREGYQTRAWAFCAERLGSYLLLKEFKRVDHGVTWARRFQQHAWVRACLPSRRFQGQMNLITESAGEGYVLGEVPGKA